MRKLPSLLIITFLVLLTASCGQKTTSEEYITKGQQYAANKDWKSAIIELKNAVKQSPKDVKARTVLAKIYLNAYNVNAALKELNKAVQLGKDKNQLLVEFAEAYQLSGQNDKIITEIDPEKATKKSQKAELYAVRAKAFMQLSQPQKARDALNKAAALDKQDTQVRLAWAQYEKSKGNGAEQKKWLKPLLTAQPPSADAWSEMAELEQKAGNFDQAEKDFSKAIELRKVVYLDYIKRAFLRISQKQYDKAREDIATLKKSGYKWPMIDHAEGLIAYQNKQYDQAQAKFEKVLSRYPGYSPSQLFLGLTHFAKANYQSAASNLEQYLADHPNVAQAQIAYSISLLKTGKPALAVKTLEQLNRKAPNNDKVMSLLGSAYLANKQKQQGISMLQKVVALKPKDAVAHLQLGAALVSSRNSQERKKGKQELQKTLQLNAGLDKARMLLFKVDMAEKKFDAARNVAQKIADQKKNSVGDNLVALTYLAQKKIQQAIKQLESTLERYPFDPLTSNNLARIYISENKLDQARQLYLSVLNKKPNDITSLTQMALLSAKANKPDEVIDWLKKSADLNPEKLSPKLLLASQYLRQGKSARAIDVLQALTPEQKARPVVMLLLAKAKIGIKEYQHAISALKGLIAKQPDSSSAHFLLAQAYGQTNNAEKMREELKQTLRIRPDHLAANLALARLDLFEKKIDAFKKRISGLMEIYPDNAEVQFMNAKIVSENKDYKDAIKTLSSIMKKSPNSAVTIDLARNYWKTGDRAAAISSLELWVQNNKNDRNALALLAQFYLAENRDSDAMKTYQTLDSLIPDNAVILNNMAWLMLSTDARQGIKYAQRALKLSPDNPFILDTLAMLQLKNGEPAQALDTAGKAAKAKPNLVDIQIDYARALKANQRTDEARNLLNNLLSRARNPAVKQKVRDALDSL